VILMSHANQLQFVGIPVSVFGQADDFATIIALGIVSVIINMFLTKKHLLISYIIIFLSIFILIKTNARAPLYGFIVLLVFWLFFRLVLFLYKKNKHAFNIISFSIIIICLITAVLYFRKYTLTQMIGQLILLTSKQGDQGSDFLRLQLIEKSISIFFNSHLTGVGPGQSVVLLGTNVHNFFLEILSEYGLNIIGVIAIFISIFKAYKAKLSPWLASLIMAFVPSFVMISISSSSTNKLRIVWIFLSLVFLLVNFNGNNAEKPHKLVEDVKRWIRFKGKENKKIYVK